MVQRDSSLPYLLTLNILSGGKREEGDATASDTACREMWEESGGETANSLVARPELAFCCHRNLH